MCRREIAGLRQNSWGIAYRCNGCSDESPKMTKPRPIKYSHSDIANAESRYEATGDPMFLALAVGALPHKPPLWVIEACAKLVDKISVNTDQGDREKMGQRLDEMWRFFVRAEGTRTRDAEGRLIAIKAPPIAAAVRHALTIVDATEPGDSWFESGASNLQQALRRERGQRPPAPFIDPDLFDDFPLTPRGLRIFLEWGDADAGHPYSKVSLQIARHDRGVG